MQDDLPASVQRSLLSLVFSSLGVELTILLALAGMLSLVMATLIVTRGRGPLAGAALVMIAAVPMLIGIFTGLQGAIATFIVIAQSAMTPKPAELAEGPFRALMAPLAGILAGCPGGLVALVGSLIRTLAARPEQGSIVDAGTDHRGAGE